MNSVRSLRTSDAQSDQALYDGLSDSRRRLAVSVLADQDSPVALSDLATEVAQRERDADHVPRVATERIAVTLHHLHLPKLDDADVVDYDPAEKTVRPVRVEELASFVGEQTGPPSDGA